jgi:hypothetical protein
MWAEIKTRATHAISSVDSRNGPQYGTGEEEWWWIEMRE